jgi:hypothetical protein
MTPISTEKSDVANSPRRMTTPETLVCQIVSGVTPLYYFESNEACYVDYMVLRIRGLHDSCVWEQYMFSFVSSVHTQLGTGATNRLFRS